MGAWELRSLGRMSIFLMARKLHFVQQIMNIDMWLVGLKGYNE